MASCDGDWRLTTHAESHLQTVPPTQQDKTIILPSHSHVPFHIKHLGIGTGHCGKQLFAVSCSTNLENIRLRPRVIRQNGAGHGWAKHAGTRFYHFRRVISGGAVCLQYDGLPACTVSDYVQSQNRAMAVVPSRKST